MKREDHLSDLEIMSRAERYRAWMYATIAPYIGSTAIEVGAGTGNIASLYAGKLKRGVFVEPNAVSYAELARVTSGDTGKVSTYNTDLRGYLDRVKAGDAPRESFESALYINVLEHVKDDIAEMASVREILQPGGRIILFVPAWPWLYSPIDRTLGHYRRYTRLSLTIAVSAAGFRITKIDYVNLIGIPGWLINRITGRRTQASSLITVYDRLFTPLINLTDKVTLRVTGLSLFAVAEKV